MACPGSVAVNAAIPGRPTSIFAAEGTAAHWLVEWCLRIGDDAQDWLGHEIKVEGYKFTVDLDMASAVQMMLDHVRSVLDWIEKNVVKDPMLRIEFGVDLSWLRPGMFGTADVVIVAGGMIWVIDYKHGRGEVVDVINNPQLMYYALGPTEYYFGVNEITMCIVQPRADHPRGRVRNWTVMRGTLMDWGRDVLGPAVDATRVEKPSFAAGDHCKWCGGLATCPTAHEHAQKEAALDFSVATDCMKEGWAPDAVVQVEVEKLVQVMKAAPFLEGYIKAVREEARRRIRSGEGFPGYKLIRGTAHRKWKGGVSPGHYLTTRGVDEDDLFTRKMVSPNQAETLLAAAVAKEDRKEAKEGLKEFWEKPKGVPKLVTEDTKGDPIQPGDTPDVPEGEFEKVNQFC
jgi:hypothetical protein